MPQKHDSNFFLAFTMFRLVYFLPATPETYSEAEVPSHPALALVANSEQILTSRYSRRLITMQKLGAYDSVAATAFHEAAGPPRMAIDNVHELVYELREGGNAPIPKYRGKHL
jgi:hypothetical protein